MHLTAHLDVDLLALSTDETVTCLVELTAPTPPEVATRPGQAVVVVLDRSGSMSGEPLAAARDAIADLVRRLSPSDVFGLVTFDSSADVVIPVGRIADRPVAALLDTIARIGPGGTTDLSAGYLMGLREAARALGLAPASTGLSGATVLLLSDGHANAGVVDPVQLGEVAATAQRGATPTTTSTLGLGQRYDEVLLAAIARGGSGEHRFAPDTDAASAEFAGLVEDLLGKSVTGALLRIRPTAGRPADPATGRAAVPAPVDHITVHGSLPTWPDGDHVAVNLGDLYSSEQRQVLVGLRVPALATLGTAVVAELELAYTSLPDLELHTVTLPVSVNVVPGDEARGRVPDPRVSIARLLLDADEAKRTASEQLRHGDVDAARSALADAVLRVKGSRHLAGDDQLLAVRMDEAVADLEEVERSTTLYSREHASKLAMESWNQTSRGKSRRRSRMIEEDAFLFGDALWDGGAMLVTGDIVRWARSGRFDAVVNAANPGLQGGAGVAGAIHAAAGADLDRYCAGLPPVPVGEAVATPGFGLGVPHIIHAVGPRYGIDRPSDELLAAAHRRAIEVADALGASSLALPAISTGVYGYPVAEAAPIALRAVGEALARCRSLTHVTFVLFDDATLDAYRTATVA